MRIISGKHKGKRIIAPRNLPIRPTTDMAKESLFNIINNWYAISTIKVLDLFSGSGNIAFEFGSRGCKEIVAVDSNYNCVKFISKIATELDLPITTIKSDVFKYLDKASGNYEVIFADPPYNLEIKDFENIASKVFDNSWLSENGTLILEHSEHTDLSHLPYFTEARRYGSSVFSMFEH